MMMNWMAALAETSGEVAASGASDTAVAQSGGIIEMIVMMVAMVAIFYFLMIRPQKKQEKEAQNMRDSLAVGDEVTTIGGIIGEIVSIKEDTVTIETSKAGTKIRFLKTAIRSVDVSAASKKQAVDGAKAE